MIFFRHEEWKVGTFRVWGLLQNRRDAICEVAEELGIRIHPELAIQLEGFDSPQGIGFP